MGEVTFSCSSETYVAERIIMPAVNGGARLLKFEQLIPGRGTVDRDTNLYLLPAIRGPTLRDKLDWPGYSPRIGHWYSENPESFGRACGVLFGSYGQKTRPSASVNHGEPCPKR